MMNSYRNSFTSLSDLSQMFAAEDRNPPTISNFFDRHDPPDHNNPAASGTSNKERERRGKMANMYSTLHSFLPNLSSNKQASREKIVTEAVQLIKRLEAEKYRLEQMLKKKKVDVAKVSTVSTGSVSVSMSSDVVVAFEIKWRSDCRRRMEMMTKLIEVFERYGVEILSASVVVEDGDDKESTVVVTAAIVDGEIKSDVVAEGIKRDLLLLLSQV